MGIKFIENYNYANTIFYSLDDFYGGLLSSPRNEWFYIIIQEKNAFLQKW